MMLALLLAAAPCIEVTDRVPGWKRVPLPADAPHLAAPPSFSQFRSGERFTIIDEQVGLYRTGRANGGTTDFELPLDVGAQSVSLVFREPLRGAKVDVISHDMTLVHGQRIAGTQLSFEWGTRDVARVWVHVHQHLREPPVLMEVRVVRSVLPQQLGLPWPFNTVDSLFYFQPDAAPVRLCEAAAQPLTLRAEQLLLAK